jgi:hypothetical protein
MSKSTRIFSAALAAALVLTFIAGDAMSAKPKKPRPKPKRKPQPSGIELPKNITKDKLICFALYTVHNNVLKLTAQLYPLASDDPRTVRLEIKKGDKFVQIAETKVIDDGWTAPFRVEKWDTTKDIEYRVAYGKTAFYTGIVRKDPVDKDAIVVVAFTGNSVRPQHGGDLPKDDLVKNIKKIKPDLLFFSGDQVYDHRRHYEAWIRFGRDFGDVIRNIPTVTIPDDHDAGQANLWGAGGKKSNTGAGHDGGYFRPAEYVKQVERAQTSHLPDPFDPTPILQGIGVYYTELTVGRVSFAIIEDRKFKSGPQGLVPKQGPRPDHIRNPNYDPKSVDVPGAVLLGERQLKFLRHWASNWNGADMKAVLSQTVFANVAHIHGGASNRLHADMDSNGWPQTGRNKAVSEIRKAYAPMICGDQHLGTLVHHGVEDWRDSGYSFCVPSIANLYLRWWKPLEEGKNREKGMPDYTGDHLDGFANKVTIWAAANPDAKPKTNNKLTTRAAGFGVIKFNRKTRKITMECWPRNVDITDPATKQYLGWPKTVAQEDNYGRKPVAYLPTLKIAGDANPVVQIIDESDERIVYTLRINGNSFRPKVFKEGKYTIKVTHGEKSKTLKGVNSVGLKGSDTLDVKL